MIYNCRCGHEAKLHRTVTWPYAKLECGVSGCDCKKLNLAPRLGHVKEVTERPPCNFCGDPAYLDGKTKSGPWAFMCDECGEREAQYLETGTGKMQILTLPAT